MTRTPRPRLAELEDRTTPVLLLGVTATNSLVAFDSSNPGTLVSSVAVTGLQAGETLLGIDYRPATGQLFALGSTSQLYTLNALTGSATAVGPSFSPAVNNPAAGFDFNPAVDRIRVVSGTQNFRLNPDTGAVVTGGTTPADQPLTYAAGDPNAGRTPNAVAAAYTNSGFNANTPPLSTTLFDIDSTLDVLVQQGSATSNPNLGVLTTVGSLGFDTDDRVGFDIAADGTAFATLTDPGETASNLVTIDLTTGAATIIGTVAAGALQGLAVVPAGFLAVAPFVLVGADAGGGPVVSVFRADGTFVRSFLAYDAPFTGGVRVAQGDVNNDGVNDIITAPGAGGGPNVKVFDGVTGNEILSFFAYDPAFVGGVFVAAGQTTPGGPVEIVTGTDVGGGPIVSVFDASGNLLSSFFAFGSNFTGGVRVSVGELNAQTTGEEVVAAAGPGGGPVVSVFSQAGLPVFSFFAFDPAFTGGVFVAASTQGIAASPGRGGGPILSVFDSLDGQADQSFFIYDNTTFAGGVRLAAQDFDGDGSDEIVTGAGPTGGPRVVVGPDPDGTSDLSFLGLDPAFTGGIFVG